jgi:plasmid stabilization system protein ParE
VFRVEIAPRALADIEAAFLFIRQETPSRSEAWLEGLIEAIYSLEHMPERCPKAPESEDLGIEIRELFYGKRRGAYRVLFTIAGDEVRVFHVRHGSRRAMEGGEFDGTGDDNRREH